MPLGASNSCQTKFWRHRGLWLSFLLSPSLFLAVSVLVSPPPIFPHQPHSTFIGAPEREYGHKAFIAAPTLQHHVTKSPKASKTPDHTMSHWRPFLCTAKNCADGRCCCCCCRCSRCRRQCCCRCCCCCFVAVVFFALLQVLGTSPCSLKARRKRGRGSLGPSKAFSPLSPPSSRTSTEKSKEKNPNFLSNRTRT